MNVKAGQQIVQRVTLRAPHRFWRAQLQHLAPRAHNTPAKAQRVWKRATPLINLHSVQLHYGGGGGGTRRGARSRRGARKYERHVARSLISLNGFSRKPVGLLSGLFTPDPLRGVIIGKLPVINRLMAT